MNKKFSVKKGDTVYIRTGKDKGKTGDILKVDPKTGRVLVSGINIAVRHMKPSHANPEGGIKRIERPIHISNVGFLDTKSGKPTRVGRRFQDDGTKVRYMKTSGDVIE